MALSVLPLDLSRWDESVRDCLVFAGVPRRSPVARRGRPRRLAPVRTALAPAQSHARDADRGETMLLPPGRRLRFSRVMWFGLGDAKGYTEDRFRGASRGSPTFVAKAGVADWALQMPGRASGLIGARRAIEIVLEDRALTEQPITVLEDPAGQKDIAELLRSQRSAS